MSTLQFTITRDAFANAINWVARVLPARPITPVLGGIRLTTDDSGTLVLEAFDYEVSAAIRLPSAEIHAIGETLVSGRLLAAISRVFPKKPVELHLDGTTVGITCGATEFTLPTMESYEFPTLPTFPGSLGVVDAEVFAEAAAQTVVAASHDEALQINCICLEITDHETLTLFATDRYRIAMRQLPWTPDRVDAYIPGAQLLIPTRAIGEIGRMGGTDITLGYDDNLLGISGGDKRTTTRLIDAQFPNCRRAIPGEHTAVATIVVPDVAEAVNRAIPLDERASPRVRLEFEPGLLHLTGGKDGIGGVRESIEVEFAGEPLTVWVNPKYLLDGLNALHTDKARISFTGDKRPFALAAHDGAPVDGSGPFPGMLQSQPNYVYLVMPTAGDVR